MSSPPNTLASLLLLPFFSLSVDHHPNESLWCCFWHSWELQCQSKSLTIWLFFPTSLLQSSLSFGYRSCLLDVFAGHVLRGWLHCTFYCDFLLSSETVFVYCCKYSPWCFIGDTRPLCSEIIPPKIRNVLFAHGHHIIVFIFCKLHSLLQI